MCMSVKKIEERICAPKNEVLEQKLQEITKSENIDNFSLNMVSDSYGFGLIYAISGVVLGVVKMQESEILTGVKLAMRKYWRSEGFFIKNRNEVEILEL